MLLVPEASGGGQMLMTSSQVRAGGSPAGIGTFLPNFRSLAAGLSIGGFGLVVDQPRIQGAFGTVYPG